VSAAERKDDHVRLAAAQHPLVAGNGFDDVRLLHHALSGIDAADVRLDTEVAGLRWSAPFYINAMTGGSARTGEINRALATAAAAAGVPIASGSMSVALDDPDAAPTFRVLREENPDGLLFANIGIERSADDAIRAVSLVDADALQVHVNAVQEIVMPEGARSFGHWISSLERIVAAVEVPVIVKEVGFGFSRRTLSVLGGIGVAAADVAGRGGTDFVRIENARRADADFGYLAGWGQSAVECLLDAPADAPSLLASGGVRTPLDVVRGLALGAGAVGVSGTFLRIVLDGGSDALSTALDAWKAQLRALMTVLGARTSADLAGTDLIIGGTTAEFARARAIDITSLAHRSDALGAPGRSRNDR
jgi:isopentenyl-diphosphate delta-isomerase